MATPELSNELTLTPTAIDGYIDSIRVRVGALIFLMKLESLDNFKMFIYNFY